MFPKFLEDSYKIANQKHFLECTSISIIEDDNSMFLNHILNLKLLISQGKNKYIDFLSYPEYYDLLVNMQKNKISEILHRCSQPEKKSLMPYLIKFLRYTDFLNKENERFTHHLSKSNLDGKFEFGIDPEKLNQHNQLFSKLNKSKIINLDNVSNEVVMVYLDNKSQKDSILTPTNIDIDYFHSRFLTESEEAFSPDSIKHKAKHQPKVLMMTSNLENNIKTTSFVNLKQKSCNEELHESGIYRSVKIHKDANKILKNHECCSSKLQSKENLDSAESFPHFHLENGVRSSTENEPQLNTKLNLRIFNTDVSIGLPSPKSNSNRLVNKINNYYVYYHTVKRNVNPTNHRRQYSKSIQFSFFLHLI